VSDVVALSESIYSPAFYWPLKEHSGDCATGSNFFSAGQVSASKENSSKNFVYPKRSGWPELLNIKNRVLSVFRDDKTNGYQNLKWYLRDDAAFRVALFVWIARNWDVFNNPISFTKDLKNECQKYYSKELINVLFPAENEIASFISDDLVFSDSAPNIEPKDIECLFQGALFVAANDNEMKISPYLAAIRTKPFILLAGISGTGKSRMVRQLARGCCPEKKDGQPHPLIDEQKPGNFEQIPVRPNWHDSTELMGYVTRITETNKPKYVLTPFVKFLVKAWLHKDVPFFLCLDEMNLAPVEQYFAEYLSTIETRKLSGGEIVTDVLVEFSDEVCESAIEELLKPYKPAAGSPIPPEVTVLENAMRADKGIRIPSNLVVMGTVNMDETTCSFSRKVLDRAMSFELNDVEDMYTISTAGNPDVVWGAFNNGVDNRAKQTYVTAENLYAETDVTKKATNMAIGEKVLNYLKAINTVLDKTPFKVAYRTRNEMMLYCVERGGDLAKALDEVTSMKILSRIEGDSQHVTEKWLGELSELISAELAKVDGYDESKCNICRDKLNDMKEQVQSGYTSFWMR
jgi:hypothetical protein